jgi:hypothetical protein
MLGYFQEAVLVLGDYPGFYTPEDEQRTLAEKIPTVKR